ncbi:MAG: DUF1176 domain-containing protein [Sphingomonas sp.]
MPALAQSAEPIQSYDSYRSWFVACDNTLSCVVKGFDGDRGGSEMRIERDAGPAGTMAATISATDRFAPADVRIDGAPAGLTGPAWSYSSTQDGTSVTSTDLTAIRALVQKLRNAKTITLGGDASIPLDGFSAAMLRLDDRQGRNGGMTALIKPGALPAARVPAAPPLPRIPAHPIQARLKPGEDTRLIERVRAEQKALFDKECSESPQQPEAHALDDARALVLIPCIMGAYQGSSFAFLAPRGSGKAERLILPLPYRGNDSDPASAAYLTEAGLDPKTGTLSMGARGRAMADCGISASWIWNGRAFQLSAMTLQQSCGGLGDPGDWPTLFRSRQ